MQAVEAVAVEVVLVEPVVQEALHLHQTMAVYSQTEQMGLMVHLLELETAVYRVEMEPDLYSLVVPEGPVVIGRQQVLQVQILPQVWDLIQDRALVEQVVEQLTPLVVSIPSHGWEVTTEHKSKVRFRKILNTSNGNVHRIYSRLRRDFQNSANHQE
jgi:hypothetical protein